MALRTPVSPNNGLTLDAAIRAASAEVLAERDELVETMLRRLADEIDEFDVAVQPELAAPVRRSCVANLTEALAIVTGDRELPRELPTESLAETRSALALGIALDTLEQNYRVCHAVLWERFMVAVEESSLAAEVRVGVLRHGWRSLFGYSDRVIRLVSEEYVRERERVLHSGEDRRAAQVREVLRGGIVGPSQLGYDLAGKHLAVVASGPEAAAMVKELSRALGCRLLTVTAGDDLHRWAWLASPPGRAQVLGAATSVSQQSHGRLSFGTPLDGPEGFRESKRQADLAVLVSIHTGARVTLYADVALEALALREESAARRFMTHELGPVSGSGRRMANLRKTLLTYLESGQNASSTAATLGLHDRTVAYRVRVASELLGAPVAGRATELGLALRICRVLDHQREPDE